MYRCKCFVDGDWEVRPFIVRRPEAGFITVMEGSATEAAAAAYCAARNEFTACYVEDEQGQNQGAYDYSERTLTPQSLRDKVRTGQYP